MTKRRWGHSWSDHDIDCTGVFQNNVNLKFQYDVRGADDKPIEKVKRAHPELQASSTNFCTLKPGESMLAVETPISLRFDMSRAGKYKLQVYREYEEGGKQKSVMSNKIELNISSQQ